MSKVAVVTIFISNESSTDNRVVELIARLKSRPDIHVDQSPLNPRVGDDPRWRDWYARGCGEAIANADHFVAVVTDGYDSSTWMAMEFDEALKHCREHGRPTLFVAKRASRPLPLGFKPYEDASTILLGSPEAAVAALLAHGRATASRSGE